MKLPRRVSTITKVASAALAFLFLALTLSSPISGFTLVRQAESAPANPVPYDTTSLIESLILRLDENLVEKHIQHLQDFKTRYSYRGDKCYPASDYIASVFSQNGLTVSFDEFIYGGYRMRNVIGQKTGISSPEDIFIICGHYDSTTSSAWSNAPGADDNGSGTTAVMATAEILSDYDFNSTIRFIAFCGEEQGMKGSNHYVSDLRAANESVSAVINMDMIANNPNPETTLVNLFTGSGTIIPPTSLINEIINTTVEYADIIGIQIYQAGGSANSDHYPFARYFKSIMFIEKNFSPYYHQRTDTIEKLNLTYCINITQITVATIAKMAQIIPGDNSPPAHTPGFPPNGSYNLATPAISIEITDPSPLNLTSLKMRINGADIMPVLTEQALGYNVSFSPPIPYADGTLVNVTVFAEDIPGNNFNHTWEFIVDAVPPEPPLNFAITASRIEMVKRGMVLNFGSAFDSSHALAPSVIYHNGEYKMWYAASNGTYHVCYANSSDGLTWNKYGIVLYRGAVGQPDSVYATYPTVIYDGEYKMWYSGYDGTNCRILYANSSNGINWFKHGIAIDIGAPGEMDSTWAYLPCVLKTTEYKMWYSGMDGLMHRILYANSTDGITWMKYNSDITPDGAGRIYGDATAWSPEVAYNNGEYHMYYGRYDGYNFKIVYANSSDGIEWNELGLAVDIGKATEYDMTNADYCSVLVTDNETKIWYSGFNNVNWRIMFANITSTDIAKDLTLTWVPSTSSDAASYEVFRESRPSAFRQPLERAHPEFYTPPIGLTPWIFESEATQNLTVYGPVTGTDPPFFYLPDDNIQNIGLYLRSSTGGWQKLTSGSDYAVDLAIGHVEIYSVQFTVGCTLHAFYNHSAGKAMRVQGNIMADVRAGSNSNKSYYYVIRVVDRAGNYAYCSDMPVKIGTAVTASWNLLCNPFLEGQVPISDALSGLKWAAARTWDPAGWPHQWTINVPGRPESLNSLQTLDRTTGVWVKASATGAYAAIGHASNMTINLVAGWNLISYPHLEIKSVSEALVGIPWDRVTAYDGASPSYLAELSGNDPLLPGQGFWVRVTSDAVWNAVNVP